MYKYFLLLLLSFSFSSYGFEDTLDSRYQEILDASDILWCDEYMCIEYKTKEMSFSHFDDPVGFTVLINDESFKVEEIERYKNRLMAHWVSVLNEDDH